MNAYAPLYPLSPANNPNQHPAQYDANVQVYEHIKLAPGNCGIQAKQAIPVLVIFILSTPLKNLTLELQTFVHCIPILNSDGRAALIYANPIPALANSVDVGMPPLGEILLENTICGSPATIACTIAPLNI